MYKLIRGYEDRDIEDETVILEGDKTTLENVRDKFNTEVSPFIYNISDNTYNQVKSRYFDDNKNIVIINGEEYYGCLLVFENKMLRKFGF